MLCCVYHPVEKFRVVEEDVRDKLLETGVWFNTPTEAKLLRKDYEERIRKGEKPRKQKAKRKTCVDG